MEERLFITVKSEKFVRFFLLLGGGGFMGEEKNLPKTGWKVD